MSLSGERGSTGDSMRSEIMNWVPSMRVTIAVSCLGPESSTPLTDLAVGVYVGVYVYGFWCWYIN